MNRQEAPPRLGRPRLLAAEWLALLGLLGAGIGMAAGHPLLLPAGGGPLLEIFSGSAKYAQLLIYAVLLYAAVTIARGWFARAVPWEQVARALLLGARLLLSLVVALYLMLLFKWWSHLGPAHYDALYHSWDLALSDMREPLLAWAAVIGLPSLLYFRVFALCFVLSYLLLAAFRMDLFVRLVTATVAVCILGGASYMIAPAYGPFIFQAALPDVLSTTQRVMLTWTDSFTQTRGALFDPLQFEAVLGAMPSLHVAHTVVIAWFMAQFRGWLGTIFSALALYVAVYAIVTGFHYIADLPAGLLVAAIAIIVAESASLPRLLYRVSAPVDRH